MRRYDQACFPGAREETVSTPRDEIVGGVGNRTRKKMEQSSNANPHTTQSPEDVDRCRRADEDGCRRQPKRLAHGRKPWSGAQRMMRAGGGGLKVEGVAGHLPLEWVVPYREGAREKLFPEKNNPPLRDT